MTFIRFSRLFFILSIVYSLSYAADTPLYKVNKLDSSSGINALNQTLDDLAISKPDLSGNNNFTGDNNFSGSITANNIHWADGTISTTASSGGSGSGDMRKSVEGISIALSTTSLQSQINNISLATSTISSIYLTQSSATITYLNKLGKSADSDLLDGQDSSYYSIKSDVSASTTSITSSLNNVILSTGIIQSSLNSVILSTGLLETNKLDKSSATITYQYKGILTTGNYLNDIKVSSCIYSSIAASLVSGNYLNDIKVSSAIYASNGSSGGGGTVDIFPVGSIIPYTSTSTIPDSFLYCDGSIISRSIYSSLFAVIGTKFGAGDGSTTFAIPDARGMFLRGVDNGKGLDSEPGRVIGSTETDKMQGHAHNFAGYTTGSGAPTYATVGVQNNTGVMVTHTVNSGVLEPIQADAPNDYGIPRVGLETRPKNIAVCYIIKYQLNVSTTSNLLTTANTWTETQTQSTTIISSATITNATITGSINVVPTGVIQMYSGVTAPSGFLLCDGSAVSTTTYSSLYGVIGFTYGNPGSGNMNLPDMRGVFPKGAGTTNRALGKDANGNYYAGTLGTYLQDKSQGHVHNVYSYVNAPANGTGMPNTTGLTGGALTPIGAYGWQIGSPIADGVNGTPRTGNTTEPQSLSLTYIIKY